MPTECTPAQFEFPRLEGRAVVASFDGGRITTDAGALLPGAADRVIGRTRERADRTPPVQEAHREDHLSRRDEGRRRQDPPAATLSVAAIADRPDARVGRGVQYVSIRYTERLAEAGIEPSVGSVGDGDDNALAETINGRFTAEVIHRRGPWRSFEAVEFATLEWVNWFNHRRPPEPIGNLPPQRPKRATMHRRRNPPWPPDPNHTASGKTGAVQFGDPGCA